MSAPASVEVRLDDLSGPEVAALLSDHLAGMHATSPPGSVHALDPSALRHPSVTFWTAWVDGSLAGCGALKELSPTAGEVKSMRTAPGSLRRGVAAAVLAEVVATARSRGYAELLLETGHGPAFDAAHALYLRHGFVACGPFGDYTDDPFSRFFRLDLLDADRAAKHALELLCDVLPGGWSRRVGHALVGETALPVPSLNGLWVGSAALEPADAAAALDEVGFTHSLQVDARQADVLAPLAVERGLVRDDDGPLMVLAGPPPAPDPRLVVRRLAPEEVGLHAELAGRAFGAPPEVFAALVTPDLARVDGAQVLVGEVDGEPVCTAFVLVQDGAAGVYNMATPPEHQRRGYGAAMTAATVAAAREAGATWAWLQSSAAGHAVYERLGFRTVATWQVWVTPPYHDG